MNPKPLNITCNNIGFVEINKLINDKGLAHSKKINVVFEKTESNIYGEVDPVFLSYLILFFDKIPSLEISFDFTKNEIDHKKAFALSHQLGHILYLNRSINNNQIKIIGNFINEGTGEIKSISIGYLTASESFIPPIFINNTNIEEYFGFIKDKNKIHNLYLKKLIEEIKNRIKRNDSTTFVKDLELEKLSFIECSVFLLLVGYNKNLYKSLKALEGKKSKDGEIPRNIRENKRTVVLLKSFVKDVTNGLKELAKNIKEHSRDNKGIITVRRFNKDKLLELKSEDEKQYLKIGKDNLFLDINVLDLGNEPIREQYLKNIKKNQSVFESKIKSKISHNKNSSLTPEKIKKEIKRFKKLIQLDLDTDYNFIKNTTNFKFKDFFVINKKIIDQISHQKNKLISRIGLHYFTELVKGKYLGFIKVSSGKERTIIYNENPQHTISNDFVSTGTFFSCLIPIRNQTKNDSSIKSLIKNEESSSDLNIFSELENFESIEYDSLTEKSEITEKHLVKKEIRIDDSKYDYLFDILINFRTNKNVKKSIFVLNARTISKSLNGSEWLRLIWALNESFSNIIIYDIDLNITKDIIDIRKVWHNSNTKEIRFWEENSNILFYSKKLKKDNPQYFRYGANLLAGKNINDFNILNSKIWRHHYSHKDNVFETPSYAIKLEDSHCLKSPFFNKEKLHYFEVLLTINTDNEDVISLFEKSVQYSLNTLFLDKQSSSTNNKGYKIDETHFRLGSKIHITDFYYAKKLFQNSFFTTPLAYLLSETIWINSKKSFNSLKNTTIVGYDNYSSFLISSVRNFLNKKIEKQDLNLNHCTINKDGIISREIKKLNDKVIIIVPIATSFNTSLKIEEQLNGIKYRYNLEKGNKGKLKFNNLYHPFYNIILVTHKDEETILFKNRIDNIGNVTEYLTNEPKTKNIFHKYKWETIDKLDKIVTIKPYKDSENSRRQKYLIPVYTEWNSAQDCELCFPNKLEEEKCLIETGGSSITPKLIFGMPKTKASNGNTFGKGIDLSNSLLYGYLKKKKNRYLYFNRTGKLIKNNEDNIIAWLQELKNDFDKKTKNKKVVLVSPASGSRSKFLDLVIEHLFEYSANSIIISLEEDYIENAEALYADGLHNADVVIYVDDVLSTINSFLETNYIIKYIRKKTSTGVGIDYCISLINRMSFSNEENLLLKLLPLVNNKALKISTLIEKTKILIKNGKEVNKNKILTNRKEIERLSKLIIENKISLNDTADRLFYFTKINNPSIEEANNIFPLKKERERYKSLSNHSSLDSIRKYFNDKRENIKPYDLKDKPKETLKDYSINKGKRKNKKLYQLLVLDALYTIFQYDFINEDNQKEETIYNNDRLIKLKEYFDGNINSFKKLETKVIELLKIDFFHSKLIKENEKNIKFVILKIICSTPLIYYKEIRESAFHWVLLELIKLKKEIEKIKIKEDLVSFFEVNGDNFYSQYQSLKFYLKKSVKLQSNFIIHNDFFATLKPFIDLLQKEDSQIYLREIKNNADKVFKDETNKLFIKIKNYHAPVKLELIEFVQDCLSEKLITDKEVDIKGKKKDSLNAKKNENESILKFFKIQNRDFYTELYKSIDNYNHKVKIENNKNRKGFIENPLLGITFSPEKTLKKDIKNQEIFDKDIKYIKKLSKFKISSSKLFIYHLVSLIQELVYEHETKSIELNKNINNIIFEQKGDRIVLKKEYKVNIINGDFNHYLRLLRLENTEIITKLWRYISDKAYKNKYGVIEENYLNKIDDNYKNDSKHKQIVSFQQGSSINLKHFLYLKGELQNFRKYKKYKIDTSIEEKIKDILKNCVEIITEKKYDKKEDYINPYLTVTYGNDLKESYTFSLKNNKEIQYIDNKESLTRKFIKGINAENLNNSSDSSLSNLEIIKDEEGNCNYRLDIFKENEVEDNIQIKNLKKNTSILFIRISDFKVDIKTKIQKLETQAIFTFYINNTERIEETNLRLLLTLKNNLSLFLKKQTSGNTFLELLTHQKNKKYQKHLKHGIGYYTSYQLEIVQEYENIKNKIKIPLGCENTNFEIEKQYISIGSKKFKEFRLLNNSIKGQIGVNEEVKENNQILFFYEYLIDIIDIIYSSKRLSYRKSQEALNYTNEISFLTKKIFKPILLPTPIIKSVIPELLFNQKKYGCNRKIQWEEDKDSFSLILSNDINKYGLSEIEGYGTNMCKEIERKYKNIEFIEEKDIKNYKLTLNVKK